MWLAVGVAAIGVDVAVDIDVAVEVSTGCIAAVDASMGCVAMAAPVPHGVMMTSGSSGTSGVRRRHECHHPNEKHHSADQDCERLAHLDFSP